MELDNHQDPIKVMLVVLLVLVTLVIMEMLTKLMDLVVILILEVHRINLKGEIKMMLADPSPNHLNHHQKIDQLLLHHQKIGMIGMIEMIVWYLFIMLW